MKHLTRCKADLVAIACSLAFLSSCSDTATFGTGTSVGIAGNVNTEQVQIGYARVELFQGPNYPDAGDAPAAVGFFASDLSVFSPKIKQLYATGEAARIVTTPQPLVPCPSGGKASEDAPPNLCTETAGTLSGDRRPFVFGTGTSLGLRFGFAGDVPSSVNLGYDREELSIIPLHSQTPTSEKPDRYSSVLASVDLNVTGASLAGTDLKLTQFFATGAAARNLAKNPVIQNYFSRTAVTAVDPTKVAAVQTVLKNDQSAIDAYFQANSAQPFATVRDKLLKDPELASIAGAMPSTLTTAGTAAAFDAVLSTDATFVPRIAAVANRLNPTANTAQ